ncbi:MAG: hypothetical protein U0132_11315 [Gemmatimonadaceae bacterium]
MVVSTPIPQVPWQITGNHWLALPCIHPGDGGVYALGVLHRGSRAAVEFAGSPDFLSGKGAALARPVFEIDGQRIALDSTSLAWERAFGWLPTFTCTIAGVLVRATVFAPYGRDADTAGAVYAFAFESRRDDECRLTILLEGELGHRQLRVRTARPFADDHLVSRADDDTIVLRGAALPGVAAVAIGSDGDATVEVPNEGPARYVMRRGVRVPPQGHADAAFFFAVGPEGDGAVSTVGVMRRRGWRSLLSATRDALRALEQSTGHEAVDGLVNRNLLLCYFYSVARGLDDAHFYLVRTRAPWHSRGVTVREWEALTWTIPAVQLADAPLARELLLRACEVHGYAPGIGVRYLDGTLFEPGFCLEGAAAYALAADRYIRETGDDQVVEEPVLADTLYASHEDIATRRHAEVPLYSTEVTPSGRTAAFPYTLHANAVTAQALDVFRRTLDEETARGVQDPEAVRASVRRHFATEREGKTVFRSAVNLTGEAVADDDPMVSVLWLPLYDLLDRSDSAYRRTVKELDVSPQFLVQQCARLMGPDAKEVLQWLRRAPLHLGLAAEEVDADGRAMGNGGDAALGGLLAYTCWYTVHALGVTP